MKLLGIDYGAKRVGIAVSDSGGTIAFPRVVIPNDEHLLDTLANLAGEERVEAVVIGDTRTVSGAPNPVTDEVQKFIEALSARLSIPVETVWEAWSSIEASRFAPSGRGHDDSAAAVILQRYIDTRHPKQ